MEMSPKEVYKNASGGKDLFKDEIEPMEDAPNPFISFLFIVMMILGMSALGYLVVVLFF